MKVRPLSIRGAYLLEPEWHRDERGGFTRTFCVSELGAHGIDTRVAQTSLSSSPRAGTLRGMHYAAPTSREAKLVRCVSGGVYDVLLDMRPAEPSFRHWCAEELSRDNARALVIPPGVAHGFLTLDDESDLLYQMSEPYDASAARGVRYDDVAFGIRWPSAPSVISERDRTYPGFNG
jgi:dTDP-4-dehydrorhamnose 3,5-epimerase